MATLASCWGKDNRTPCSSKGHGYNLKYARILRVIKEQANISGRSMGGARGPWPTILFWQKKIIKQNNEKTEKEEKPAGQAIFANQFCFNISKKPGPPLSSRSGSATEYLHPSKGIPFWISSVITTPKHEKLCQIDTEVIFQTSKRRKDPPWS